MLFGMATTNPFEDSKLTITHSIHPIILPLSDEPSKIPLLLHITLPIQISPMPLFCQIAYHNFSHFIRISKKLLFNIAYVHNSITCKTLWPKALNAHYKMHSICYIFGYCTIENIHFHFQESHSSGQGNKAQGDMLICSSANVTQGEKRRIPGKYH